MTTQETINRAVAWALGIAEDSKHGYDQANRWGPNYDCSSFVITAWQEAGVPVKTSGASYTGDMYYAFIKCGFSDVTNSVKLSTGAGLKKGDVLLNKANHTELYIGGNKVVKASINEKGTTTGGQSGDQTGREIYVGGYYNFPWDCVLRYEGDKKDEVKSELPTLKRGAKGISVQAMQAVLIRRGYGCGWWGADGDFGAVTGNAVADFQRDNGLPVTSECDTATWYKLLGVTS